MLFRVAAVKSLSVHHHRAGYILLSPAFSKKSGGTLFSAFRGAWSVARGAWCMVRGSEFLQGTLSP